MLRYDDVFTWEPQGLVRKTNMKSNAIQDDKYCVERGDEYMESPEEARGFFISPCYGLNVCVLQKFIYEVLMPNVMV